MVEVVFVNVLDGGKRLDFCIVVFDFIDGGVEFVVDEFY